jgi:myo-inositol 2-dehydrogenase/D-chiro-inositol 1-dehydrogenase
VSSDNPEAFFLQRYAAAYRAEISHFFDCVQSGTQPSPSVDDGVRAQLLADAAAASWISGQPVRF